MRNFFNRDAGDFPALFALAVFVGVIAVLAMVFI